MTTVCSGPSSQSAPWSITRSAVTKRGSAAPRKSSSKYGSGPRNWPLPARSARFRMDEGERRGASAGMATSSLEIVGVGEGTISLRRADQSQLRD